MTMTELKNEVKDDHHVANTEDDDDYSSCELGVGCNSDDTTTDNSTSQGTTGNGKVEQALRSELIQSEDLAVRRSKILVACSVLVCAIAVGVSVFYFAKNSDENSFKIAFDGFAAHIVSIVQWDIQNNFALMQQVSAATTGAAMMMNATFPFVTQPTFEITGGYADGMGGIMACGFAPLITSENRQEWEQYSVDHQDWLKESALLKKWHPSHLDAVHGTFQDHEHDVRRKLSEVQMPDIPPISDTIYRWVDGEKVPEPVQPMQDYLPLWQVSPADSSAVNVNLLSDERMLKMYQNMLAMNKSVLSGYTQIFDLWDWMFDDNEKSQKANPHIFLMEPVYNTFDPENKKLAGVLTGLSSWKNVFDRLLPDQINGVICVVRGTCGIDFTYRLDGQRSIFLGIGDLHDRTYNHMEHHVQLELYEEVSEGTCLHHLHVYPTDAFKDNYMTKKPIIYTIIVSLAFILTTAVFILYDTMVTRRQEKTMESAVRTNNIVASMFPENVRQRILADAASKQSKPALGKNGKGGIRGKDTNDMKEESDRPIADFVPMLTVISADLVGFMAWSSAREPSQVFRLLEIVYGALDKIARKRRVFKVDTVGDCYVAVTGMPEPRQDHASAMARFARDSILEMSVQVKKLEIMFGPDTSELGLRIGLHSGAVTAGVLRGGNTRYQLFGDTMSTSEQMKLTSGLNRVHVSKATADLLIAAGKEHWLKLRDDRVLVKGKGEVDSYWLKLVGEAHGSTHLESNSDASESNNDNHSSRPTRMNYVSKAAKSTIDSHDPAKRRQRLIEWNVAVLLERVKMVVAKRDGIKKDAVEVPVVVQKQLNQFVHGIASMYRDNPFHNFEHASHVTMSVTKVLSRVVSGEELQSADYTRNIASDPLIQLATLLSALIHDADHQGIPNSQLIKEDPYMSMVYDYRSIAENNSIAVALSLFRQAEFESLRSYICPTKEDYYTFSENITKVVLATDIMDKDLKSERNTRWAKAFGKECENDENINEIKAHIVLEHIIQASDVCHTMQHWSIYQKWNERLFLENYRAYKAGRAEKNPAEYWYAGEIGFFDFYIIPLAKKLEECGVFGVSSDEFLNYAYHNRSEWELRGMEVVEEYVEKYCLDQAK